MMKSKLALLVAAAAFASTANATEQTSFINIPINTQQVNNGSILNLNPDPLTIVVFCNATAANKRIEAWVRRNVQDTPVLVASESGTERQSVTFVVPVGWHFIITVATPAGTGIPAGGACSATAWWTE